jgi:hypothetical protein
MKVSLSVGRTVNIGNYESIRVEVGSEYSHSEIESDKLTTLEALRELYHDLSDGLQKVIDVERKMKR